MVRCNGTDLDMPGTPSRVFVVAGVVISGTLDDVTHAYYQIDGTTTLSWKQQKYIKTHHSRPLIAGAVGYRPVRQILTVS